MPFWCGFFVEINNLSAATYAIFGLGLNLGILKAELQRG
jgi:hypothetical protein